MPRAILRRFSLPAAGLIALCLALVTLAAPWPALAQTAATTLPTGIYYPGGTVQKQVDPTAIVSFDSLSGLRCIVGSTPTCLLPTSGGGGGLTSLATTASAACPPVTAGVNKPLIINLFSALCVVWTDPATGNQISFSDTTQVDQNLASTLGATFVIPHLDGAATVRGYVSGIAGGASVVFEGSNNPTAVSPVWFTIPVYRLGALIAGSTMTTDGQFAIDMAGRGQIRLRTGVAGTGTMKVTYYGSSAPSVENITGGGGASTPFTPTGNVSLAVTTATARVALPTTDAVAILVNNGTSDLYFKLGNGSVTAATTDTFLGAGRGIAVAVAGGQTNIAAITASGTASLVFTQGTGSPFFSGGGGGGGGGGAVTNAGTFAVQNTASIPAGSALIGSVTLAANSLSVPRKLGSSTLTRIANTTAYAGTSAAPQAVCLFTSVTICAPLTLTVSAIATVSGSLLDMRLFKSSLGTTGATFRVLAYQGAPTLTSTFDSMVYTPKLADAAVYVGAWNCLAQVVNGDNSAYECTSTSGDGHQTFQLTDGTLRFVIETTGLYAPASGETFSLVADILASAP